MGVIIGICDDEKLYIQKLKSIMRALFQEKENLYEIYTFLSGRELLEYCEKKKCYLMCCFWILICQR